MVVLFVCDVVSIKIPQMRRVPAGRRKTMSLEFQMNCGLQPAFMETFLLRISLNQQADTATLLVRIGFCELFQFLKELVWRVNFVINLAF